MNLLNQKKNFTRRTIRLSDAEVVYEIAEKGSSNEIAVPFEELDRIVVTSQRSNPGWLFFGGLALVAVCVFLLMPAHAGLPLLVTISLLLLGLGAIIIYFATIERYWKLKVSNGNYIYLHQDVPNRKKVDQFIDRIYARRDAYLRREYGMVNPNLDYQSQFLNFKTLRKLKVWKEDEYRSKLEELDFFFRNDFRVIGFNDN